MMKLKRLVLASALAALPWAVSAQDLLSVWRAAAEHDHQLLVARAQHGASQTLRELADALGRPMVGLSLAAGLGAGETAMRGAQFSAPGMGQVERARFGTSVNGGLATRLGLEARQQLINPARDAQQAQMRLGAEMGDLAWRGAQTELMLGTAQRYFELALAEAEQDVVARQLTAVSRARDEAHERYELGGAPITDRHEADAALAGVRAQQSAAELQASVKRQALAGSTGLAQPTARLPGEALPAVDDLPVWQQAAQEGNLRLRLLRQAVELAEQKLQEGRAAGRPSLDLVAQVGHQRLAGHGDYGGARNRSADAMVGVQLSVPLYTGGRVDAQQRKAAEEANQARAELDLAREEVSQQVRAAWLGLKTGTTRIQALQEGLKASTDRLEATRLGLEVGHRTTLDLLNAENAHAAAELALAQARSEQVFTRLQLAALADRLDEDLLAQVNSRLATAQERAHD